MIEKKFIKKNVENLMIESYIKKKWKDAGISKVEVFRTPLGYKITIWALRTGILSGREGETLTQIAEDLKKKFNIENPVIEVKRVENPFLDPNIVAFLAVKYFEKYGRLRFKAIGYNLLRRVMEAGARGAEIYISGPIPGDLHHTWPFRAGYLPKSGESHKTLIKSAIEQVRTPRSAIGIKVFILPPDAKMPDEVDFITVEENEGEGAKEEK